MTISILHLSFMALEALGRRFTPALIVIDLQNDFVSGSLPVPGGAEIVDTVNHLLDLPFALKIATKDFHPANHVSFALRHDLPVFTKATIFHPCDKDRTKGLEQVLWPAHCVVGTSGANFVPGLNTDNFTAIIHKGVDADIESYSAFRDIWHYQNSDLTRVLNKDHVTDVFFVGLAGDYCVKYTALDSVYFGFDTWVVRDAVRCISDDNIAWDEMEKKGIRFVESAELIAKLTSEA